MWFVGETCSCDRRFSLNLGDLVCCRYISSPAPPTQESFGSSLVLSFFFNSKAKNGSIVISQSVFAVIFPFKFLFHRPCSTLSIKTKRSSCPINCSLFSAYRFAYFSNALFLCYVNYLRARTVFYSLRMSIL